MQNTQWSENANSWGRELQKVSFKSVFVVRYDFVIILFYHNIYKNMFFMSF